MDAELFQGEYIGGLDELEEEFNVVPANRAPEVCDDTLPTCFNYLLYLHP
jgi:hypothetical protein